MTLLFVVVALTVGVLGGSVGLWLVQRRGWFTLGQAVEDGQETLALFVEGLRCVSGKSSAPCAKCGYRPGSGATKEDVAKARSVLRAGRWTGEGNTSDVSSR